MKKRRVIFLIVFVIFFFVLLLPQDLKMPVEGAGSQDYNHESFWYYPWGKSGTHKGVDIFAKASTPVHSATSGWVIYTGQLRLGGNVILVLGPKWRLHYYAHLKDVDVSMFSLVNSSTQIGSVGNTGNAAGKPAHLHYAIMTLIPYVFEADDSPQGWKKMFYLNPIEYL